MRCVIMIYVFFVKQRTAYEMRIRHWTSAVCSSDLVKYLNNVIEADHGKLKILIKPVRGFKSIPTAYATIKGFEVMRALRTGQARPWCLKPGIRGEVRLVERAFGIGPSALTAALGMRNPPFAPPPSPGHHRTNCG